MCYYRAEFGLRIRQLPQPGRRQQGHLDPERPPPAEQDHQGVLRQAQLGGNQGSQPVRLWVAQAHGTAGSGEAFCILWKHHHLQDTLRQHHR